MRSRTKLFYQVGYLIIILCLTQGLMAQDSKTLNGFNLSNTSIPVDEIFPGGPPKDGIPAIDEPKFIKSNKAEVREDERILGVMVNGKAKAYPIRIMNYHEIVNDVFADQAVVVTYCPLCGSGIAFNASINGKQKTFGVSGLLYNSDVLLYDRQTESLWSQIMAEAVAGPEKGEKLEIIPTSNTTWGEWKKEHPDSYVLSENTGYARDYSVTPYKGYEESERLYFSVSKQDRSFHPKERVLGITLEGISKAYPFSELQKSQQDLIHDQIGDKEIMIKYNPKTDSAEIMDKENRKLEGITLFWFAWYAFHPDTEIYRAK